MIGKRSILFDMTTQLCYAFIAMYRMYFEAKMTSCYMCSDKAVSKEHFPPKVFFPKEDRQHIREGLTKVPSCAIHNNHKSSDDMYVLTCICSMAIRDNSQAEKVFNNSILPQFKRRPAFKEMFKKQSIINSDNNILTKIDINRFDNFFDHLCHAIYFHKKGKSLNSNKFTIKHQYRSILSSNTEIANEEDILGFLFDSFFREFSNFMIDNPDSYHSVYKYSISDPSEIIPAMKDKDTSITIAHSFYGIFEVVSLLTCRLGDAGHLIC